VSNEPTPTFLRTSLLCLFFFLRVFFFTFFFLFVFFFIYFFNFLAITTCVHSPLIYNPNIQT